MIVRKNLKLAVMVRVAWKAILWFAILGALSIFTYEIMEWKAMTIPFAIVATLGTALAIILAFRNNASYDRWWEARKIWGGIVNYSRTFSRQLITMVGSGNEVDKAIHQRLIYRQIAWINALRFQLRKQDKWEEIKPFLSADEYDWLMKRQNKATHLILKQGEELAALQKEGLMDDFRHMQLDNSLTEFYNLQGMAERIKNTPLARQYDFFPKIFMHLFIFLFLLA